MRSQVQSEPPADSGVLFDLMVAVIAMPQAVVRVFVWVHLPPIAAQEHVSPEPVPIGPPAGAMPSRGQIGLARTDGRAKHSLSAICVRVPRLGRMPAAPWRFVHGVSLAARPRAG